MTIKEIMEIGTSGMSTAQKQEEKERRIGVGERINLLQVRMMDCEREAKKVEKGSEASKMLNRKIRSYAREMRRIKASESEWLREAAWFLYA